MRALKAIAILVFGVAGCIAVRAADLPAERAAHDVFTYHVPSGDRVGPIVIYDFQPGVVVRAYWASPWRHRHYFPFDAEKIDVDVSDNPKESTGKRVIRAEAEVTIHGPDRMSIRLFRKGHNAGRDANAE